jgi:hypothetical protein
MLLGDMIEISPATRCSSITLSYDGNIVAFSRSFTLDSNQQASVEVFEKNSSSDAWQRKGQSIELDSISSDDPVEVDLSRDGSFLAVALPSGSRVYQYTTFFLSWSIWGNVLTPSTRISLSDDGSQVALADSSAVTFWSSNGTYWRAESARSLDRATIALSGDGTQLAVGIPNQQDRRGVVAVTSLN